MTNITYRFEYEIKIDYEEKKSKKKTRKINNKKKILIVLKVIMGLSNKSSLFQKVSIEYFLCHKT